MARKRKKSRVPRKSMARPLLEAIFTRRERGELDNAGCVDKVSALMDKVGHKPVMDALVKKLETASDVERDALMAIIPELGDEKTSAYLWRIVRRSKMSAGVKTTALVILKQMGEDVDLSDPGAYLSLKRISPTDITEVERMGRYGLRAIIKDLLEAESVGEIEGMMQVFDDAAAGPHSEARKIATIEGLSALEEAGAADMLLAIVHATAQPSVRQAARDALLKLSGRGVFPQSSLVKRFSEERFYAAYCTDPSHPWQQQVTMVWEWPGDLTQAMVFLLDFGFPWRGSVKDMFVSRYVPKRELHRDLIDKGSYQQQVPFARARQFILDALEANEQYGQPLPPEYDEFRRLIERRIVHPSSKALAQAEALDAETVDEWGEAETPTIRGISFVGDKPVISLDEDAARAFEKDPGSFGNFLRGILGRKK